MELNLRVLQRFLQRPLFGDAMEGVEFGDVVEHRLGHLVDGVLGQARGGHHVARQSKDVHRTVLPGVGLGRKLSDRHRLWQ